METGAKVTELGAGRRQGFVPQLLTVIDLQTHRDCDELKRLSSAQETAAGESDGNDLHGVKVLS